MEAELSATPEWLVEYIKSYNAGEAIGYILNGDIEGVAFRGVRHRGLLHSVLRAKRDVVASYSMSSGVRILFPDEVITVDDDGAKRRVTRRARALELIGVKATQPAATGVGSLIGPASAGATQQQADPFAQARRPLQALELLTVLLRGGEGVAVIVEHAETVVPAAAMGSKGAMSGDDRAALVTLLDWARDDVIARQNANPIFLMVRDLEELHPDLRASDVGWRAIYLRMPTRDERQTYIDWYLQVRADDGRPIELRDGITSAELANNTAGLSLANIEDVLLVAGQGEGATRTMVKSYKDQVITSQYSEVAEMIDPLVGGFDEIGGMATLKEWARVEVIDPIRQGRRGDVPKGILFVGPPGTGKTWFVRGLAREVNFNAVALNASKILGGIVGESEKKLAKFLAFVKSLAPCLVFLDEFDQSDMAKRGNNSGNPVASNLFNAMLQFMSDETLRGRVVMVFATNRPDLLDPAVLRFGRMDAIVPVLLPDAQERALIAEAQARSQGILLNEGTCAAIAEQTDNWSAADIGAVVRKTRLLASRDERFRLAGDDDVRVRSIADADDVLQEHVGRALRTIRPQTLGQADYYTRLAVMACNDTDLLPERYAGLLDQREELVDVVLEAEPVGIKRGRAW